MDKVNLAAQIPESELSVMSTEQLLQVYLNSRYPGYLFIYADVNNPLRKHLMILMDCVNYRLEMIPQKKY